MALILVAALALLIWRSIPRPQPSQLPDETVEKLNGAAALPGYAYLNLQADTTKQTLTLSNPPENSCLFRISLILEDGTVLWTSDLIKPGYDSAPIRLSQPLSAGSYPNTTLLYECFTMDAAQSPLNGGSIKLTLRVKD